ncbi:MAG: D-alanine--D-alanine ligase [Clostridia bacterium]|nr:D-alanine--D-alanine ligase [Clostridia bacterium]
MIKEGLMNVAVLFGGDSVEHEVSIISAVQAMNHFDTEKYNVIPVYIAKNNIMYTSAKMLNIESFKDIAGLLKTSREIRLYNDGTGAFLKSEKKNDFSGKKPLKLDVALPVVHGTNCEDGTLQGYLEMLKIPYAGCDVLASAVGMDKAVFKSVLKTAGVPVLDGLRFSSREFVEYEANILNKIDSNIGFPLIVKPVNLGSSVGISKVNSKNELKAALDLAFSFAEYVLVERAVQNLREINCSVLGDGMECEASACEEPVMTDEILSYGDKYLSSESSKGMSSLKRKLPADLPSDMTETIKEYACRSFKAINGHGVARIDFLMDDVSKEVFVNEINTIPGSLSFYLWEATGVKYKDLLDKLVSLAFKRQRQRENLKFEIDTNILSQCGALGAKGSKGSKL